MNNEVLLTLYIYFQKDQDSVSAGATAALEAALEAQD